MIQAINDKIVVDVLMPTKTKGGLILPTNRVDPQSYGKVVSVGDEITNISVGDIIVFHPNSGMAMLMKDKLMKVLGKPEIYGILLDEEVKETLETLTVGGSQIVKPEPPGPRIIGG